MEAIKFAGKELMKRLIYKFSFHCTVHMRNFHTDIENGDYKKKINKLKRKANDLVLKNKKQLHQL